MTEIQPEGLASLSNADLDRAASAWLLSASEHSNQQAHAIIRSMWPQMPIWLATGWCLGFTFADIIPKPAALAMALAVGVPALFVAWRKFKQAARWRESRPARESFEAILIEKGRRARAGASVQ